MASASLNTLSPLMRPSPSPLSLSRLRIRPSSSYSYRQTVQPLLRTRRTQRSPLSTHAGSSDPVPRPSFLKRASTFAGRGILFTFLGLAMAVAPAYEAVQEALNPPTSAETLEMYTPPDAEAQAVEDHINSHPLVAELRSRPEFTESRPHLKIPPAYRAHSLTAGLLQGPGRVTVPPFDWTEEGAKSYVQIAHLGPDLCGHPGIVHGGFLATMLDEGLGRCCYGALPHKIAVTANLNINYRSPAPAGAYVVLHATTTKVEGRKAWVEGRIETLVGEGETPVVLVEATALFVSPRQAAAMRAVLPVSDI